MRAHELTTRVRKRVGLARAVLVVALAAGVAAIVSVAVDALAAQAYQTHGDIVGFGPNRSYVSIAHEAIPGYMGAMTMTFEPRRPAQLQGYEVGAHVAFTFTASDDGHRWIDQIFPQVK